MGKKDFGVNTKKEEARDRKDTQKKEKQTAEERKKEDAKWTDNDKKIAKKDAKDVDSHLILERRAREGGRQAESERREKGSP